MGGVGGWKKFVAERWKWLEVLQWLRGVSGCKQKTAGKRKWLEGVIVCEELLARRIWWLGEKSE